MIRVLLADDQGLVRAGFRSLLDDEDDITVVGEAADGEGAVAAARELRPDVVLMDIRMPGLDGLAAARRIAAADPAVRVVILTTFDLDEFVYGALRAGVAGFLVKDTEPEELLRAVRVAARGDALISPSVPRRLIAEYAGRKVPPAPGPRLDALTPREREITQLVAEGSRCWRCRRPPSTCGSVSPTRATTPRTRPLARPIVTIVVGLSALLLLVVFRSVLIPVKAALLNLLSIAAALGAITLVFQEGWFGVPPGPIEAFIPVMIFAIVFGLSMDYEVFLLSRIHEEWTVSRDPGRAVREGLTATGQVITAAAAIMIVVFAAFVLSPSRMLQQFGLGLAVAILLDAVVIRCLIVPAVMQLLGRSAWWLPGPLARRLPEVALERPTG